jgi:hypothetical protein
MFQGSLRDTLNFNMLFNMGGIRPSGFFSSMQLIIASTRYIQKINLIICQGCGFLLVHSTILGYQFLIKVGFSFQLFAVGTRVKHYLNSPSEVDCYMHRC